MPRSSKRSQAVNRQQEIHIILDNLSAHKIHQVEFLQRNPIQNCISRTLIFPGSIKWRPGFARLEHASKQLHFGPPSLAQAMLYIRASKATHPFKWKYGDVRRANPPMLTNSLQRATTGSGRRQETASAEDAEVLLLECK
jgi:hypothetical protein